MFKIPRISRRKFIVDLFTLTSAVFLLDAFWLERYFIETNEFYLGDADKDSENLKIIQISDMHIKSVGGNLRNLAKKINKSYTKIIKIDDYKKVLMELSQDLSIPKYATHLVYMTNANRVDELEQKVMYSILQKRPKRADIYWFVHVNILTEPYKTQYKVTEIVKDDIYRIDFNLGFREPTKINLMFREVIRDMVKRGEVDITSRYESLNKNNIIGDFKFVLSEKFLSNDSDLKWHENIIMNSYFFIKKLSLSEERAFGLDSSSVKIEKFPMVLHAPENIGLTRIIK